MAGLSYVSHKHQLVVFWSTKCASTAVVNWFCHLEGISGAGDKRNWLYEHGYRYNYRQARHICEDQGYRSIYFTRNPYGRVVSTYLNKFVIYYGHAITNFDKLERFSQKFIQSFNELNDLKSNTFHGLSFVQFLNHVAHLIATCKVLNLHWDAQLPRDISFRIMPDYVVKLETFRDDLLNACKELGLYDYVPEKLNKTTFPDHFTKSSFDESESNSLDLLTNGIHIVQSNLLNKMTADKVYLLYKEDFNFFEYSKEIELTSYPSKKKSWLKKLLNQ